MTDEHLIIEQNQSSTLAGLESLQIEDVIQKGQETLIEDMLRQHVQGLIGVSKAFSEKINTSRTKAKKDFYRKKLIKNNKEIVKYLLAAQRFKLKHTERKSDDTDHDNIKEGPQNSSAVESRAE